LLAYHDNGNALELETVTKANFMVAYRLAVKPRPVMDIKASTAMKILPKWWQTIIVA
jgi:hypothetical protein